MKAHLHSSVFPTHQFEASKPGQGISSPMTGAGYPFESSTGKGLQSQPLMSTTISSKTSSEMPPPRLSRSAGRIESLANTTNLQNLDQRNVSRYFEEQGQRPATAPLEYPVTSIDQILPPRRELPFKSSSSVRSINSSGNDRGSRSSSTALDLPPPSQASTLHNSDLASHADISKRTRKAKGTLCGAQNATPSKQQSASGTVTSSSPVVGRSSSPVHPMTTSLNMAAYPFDINPRGMQSPHCNSSRDQSRQSMSHGRSHLGEATLNMLEMNEFPPIGSVPATDKSSTQPSLSKTQDENSLAGYAFQSEEDRMNALESMVCDLVYDDDFLKLSEDVEACWRRIGLMR